MSRTAVIGPALVQCAPRPPLSCTLRELADRAQVGYASARHLVPKLASAGQLKMVGETRVDYRNRPVALYQQAQAATADDVPAPSEPVPPADEEGMSTAEIQLFMQGWPG